MGSFVDLSDRRFGRLLVTGDHVRRPYSSSGQNRTFWVCVCDCGNQKEIAYGQLVSGIAKSCGCLRSEKTSERRATHRKSGTPEHNTWKCMIKRCRNVNDPAFSNYGGRGIYVCDRWMMSFSNFLHDMGPRPSNRHSIDRINNDGPYSPENCHWATDFEQNSNTRKNTILEHNGRKLHLCEWSRQLGIKSQTICERLRRGWTIGQALSTPVLRVKR